MNNSMTRDQSKALKLEARIFTPLKEILKINILQYQGGTTLFNRQKNTEVAIDPVSLRKAVIQFKMTDGVTTASKTIHGDTLQVGMQVIGSSSQLADEYDLGPLFSYMMQTQGAHIREFEKSPGQKQYEQAMASWQQTVMSLAKQNPDIRPEQYPPQPKPADFGIGPDGQTVEPAGAEETPPTLMQQVMAIQSGKPLQDSDNDAAMDVANIGG